MRVSGTHDRETNAARELDAAAAVRRARDAALTPGERIEQAAALIKQAQKLAPAKTRRAR